MGTHRVTYLLRPVSAITLSVLACTVLGTTGCSNASAPTKPPAAVEQVLKSRESISQQKQRLQGSQMNPSRRSRLDR